ncbi:MAG: response regulator transcription factor [Planctomycetes bacterium]|nr:response regulator transcription factor [Planctomycetota bacterium]
MTIRIILADDHKILRDGLSLMIESEGDMEIIGQAENGYEAVRLAKELSPDLVIMDIEMPELNGIEATRQIVKEHPKVKVIALSMHANKKLIREMFAAGAKGYLLKDCEYEELLNAVRIVTAGKTYLTPAITGLVVDNYMLGADAEKDSPYTILSDREREVLQLLTEGKTTKQIAMMLHISPKTVEGHRTRIMNKLNIDTIANLTKYAIQEGLTSPDI